MTLDDPFVQTVRVKAALNQLCSLHEDWETYTPENRKKVVLNTVQTLEGDNQTLEAGMAKEYEEEYL